MVRYTNITQYNQHAAYYMCGVFGAVYVCTAQRTHSLRAGAVSFHQRCCCWASHWRRGKRSSNRIEYYVWNSITNGLRNKIYAPPHLLLSRNPIYAAHKSAPLRIFACVAFCRKKTIRAKNKHARFAGPGRLATRTHAFRSILSARIRSSLLPPQARAHELYPILWGTQTRARSRSVSTCARRMAGGPGPVPR